MDMNTLEIVETLPPLHPGEVLREDFMVPLGLSAGKIAKACNVPRTRIERIAAEKLGVTGDTAVRLGEVLGTGPEVWVNLQGRFETETAKIALRDELVKLSRLNVADTPVTKPKPSRKGMGASSAKTRAAA